MKVRKYSKLIPQSENIIIIRIRIFHISNVQCQVYIYTPLVLG